MIGTTLKKLRYIYGYTAVDLSKELGISKSHLSEIENGKEPSLEVLKRYSAIMGIKLSSLILLSEQYDNAEANNKSDEFTKKLMNRLIDSMSKDLMTDAASE